MIEGEKKSSAIKSNLLTLSKLKGTSKHTVQDNIKSNRKVITHHPEEEMPPQQFNEHKEEDLTNANFQIKFLLSGFFENIGEEDKPSNKVDNKLKKLFDQTMNEEDVKKWVKNNSKFTNANDSASIKQKQMRFQSSKVLSKMPFITEQISDKKGMNKDKDNDISNNNNINSSSNSNIDKVNQKKTSASSRHLPNLPRLAMKNTQKKQSRFRMQSTHNLRLVSPTLTKKSDSKEQDDNTNNTTTNENTHCFETENSNKTAYHKTKQKYTSSNKVLHIKNVSTFNSSIPSSQPKPKIIITPCYNVSNEEQCNQLNFVDQFYHGESIKKATTKKSERIKFKEPFIESDNYPLKAKTLQHRNYKGMTISSLSCGNQKQAKRLRLPSIDILDIEGLTKQNKEELNDIKNELQNHVFVNNDDSDSPVNDSKTNELHLLSSKQNLSSIINKINTNTINNDNNINNQSNNINSSRLLEESNQHLINNESSIITSGLPPITAHSKKISFEDEHRKLQQKGYVYDSLDDEEIEDQIDINFYLEPDALIVRIVDFVLFWSLLYSVFEIPYRLAHDLDLDCIRNGYINYYVISDIIIHFFLIIDIILSFFKAYRSFEYQIITNTNTITKEYLSTWFILDIISAIPFYSLLRLNAPQCLCFITKYYNAGNKSVKYILVVLRLCKICKVYLNNTWYTAMRSYLLQTEHFYLWFNMYNGILIFFMYVHSMACLFIFFAQTSHNSWIYNTNYDTAPFYKLYITAIYYVITTVTSTGYGDITITNRFEYAYNLFLLAIGVQACSYALSSFVDIINQNDDKSVEYIRSCKVLEEIRLTHKMPLKLYDKVARLLKYRMIYEKKDKNIIVDSLPLRLRNTLIYEMYKPVIQNFIFFKSFDNKDFVVRVLLAFKPILASKYDVLVKEGDYIVEVIFVKTGILSLEIAIKNKEKRSRSNGTVNEGYYTKAHMNTSYSHINLLPTKKTNMLMMYTRSSHGGLTYNKSQFMESKVSFNHISRNNNNDNDDDNNNNNKDSDESYNDLNGKTHIKSKQENFIIEYVKILEIRKNEHFGDILMFLERRSPLTVRVKSSKTELFYLEKTDAVEIASTFPVVWRKIIKKSLFNMKQMERLINKAVKVCKRVYKENYQNTKGLNDFKEMKSFSMSSQECKDSPQKMLTLIKETAPYGETSDELRSIPSSMNSVSQRSKKELTSILKHTQTQTIMNNTYNNSHQDDSFCEEDEFPTTNASRKKLLSQGHIQSIIVEDSEKGSDRTMKQVNYCKKKTSSKYNYKDSECELIDDDDNSTKHRISSKELNNNNNNNNTSNNNNNNSISNNINTNNNNNNINNLHINNSIIQKHSLFNETSIKDDSDLKRTEVLSNRDLNPIIMNSFVPLTPFKYTDINNEFYPHEVNNYMNKSPPLFKRDIPQINDITHKKGMLISLWKTPPPPKRNSIHLGYNIHNNNNNNDDNEGTILGTCLIQSSNSNRTIKRQQQQRASSFDNVSICSTTISLNYSNSYENLNEISNYSYISSPQLQSKVKLMLQSSSSDDNNNKPIPPEQKENQQEEKTYHNLKNFSFYQLRSTSNILSTPNNYLNNNYEHNSALLNGENSPDPDRHISGIKRSSKNVLNSCKTHYFDKEEQQQTSFGIGGGNTRMIHPGSKKSSILRFKGNRDLYGFTQPILPSGQTSSRGKSSMIMKPNKTKKNDLLDVIGRNIETNNQILNQPEIFCADYFQKVMVNHNNKIEQQNLYKRLLNTEKILNDIDKGGTAGGGKKSADCSPTGSKAELSVQQGNNKSECENE